MRCGGAAVVRPGACWLLALCLAVPGFAARDASVGVAMATGCCLGWLVFGDLPGGRERAACLWRTPLVADSGGNNPL